jgi:hypothetical protein
VCSPPKALCGRETRRSEAAKVAKKTGIAVSHMWTIRQKLRQSRQKSSRGAKN